MVLIIGIFHSGLNNHAITRARIFSKQNILCTKFRGRKGTATALRAVSNYLQIRLPLRITKVRLSGQANST